MIGKKPHPQTCERCPHRYSKTGCPCWITPEHGFLEENVQTGETRIVQGCFYSVIPKLMSHVVAAANRPAAAMESFRNETIRGFGMVAQAVGQMQLMPPQREDDQ